MWTFCNSSNFPFFATKANATTATNTSEEYIYFEDGSYLKIVTSYLSSRASGTKTGSKTYEYTQANGTINWKATIRGTFSYTGTSATCTACTCDVVIYDNAFYIVTKTTHADQNAAKATVTMGQKVLGISVSKNTYNLSIFCDNNGNLS